MSIQSREYLKEKFENGKVPFQDDFWDLIDTLISQAEDGLKIFKNPDGTYSLGIGLTKVASAPLSIKRTGPKESLISFHDNNENPTWGFATLNVGDYPGFNLIQIVNKNPFSRFFVDSKSGNVGIGSEKVKARLHVEGSASGAGSGIHIKNTAVAANHPGWFIQHIHDAPVKARNGGLIIGDDSVPSGKPIERVLIAPSGNVGIAEKTPDTLLHVTRAEDNEEATTDLRENTGIAQFGPVTKSVVFDFQGVQGRRGTYIGTKLQLDVSTLNIQRLGGDTLFHGSPDFDEKEKVVVKSDGRIGVGVLLPAEKLHIAGRLIVGDSTADGTEGAIRWNGTDFEGFDGTDWVSMTGGAAGLWSIAGEHKITYNAEDAMVGIGIAVPTVALHVVNEIPVDASSTAMKVINSAESSGGEPSDNRVALDVSSTGDWSENIEGKSVGLLTSASGAGKVHGNLAAVLNGNVSIGPLSNSQDMVGFGGENVLVIQDGTSPSAAVGGDSVTNGGIQIYSEGNSVGVSIFTVRNGNGDKMQFFKGAALTAALTDEVTNTYTSVEANVIKNLVIRVNQLEARLRANGLLT